MKKTKIMCTMGPNMDNRELMTVLAANDMDIARSNFPHGDYEEQRNRLNLPESVRKEVGLPIAALFNTKRPGIHTGLLEDDKKAILRMRQMYTLTTREITGDDTVGHTNHNGLNEDVSAGNRILTDDGLIELRVERVDDTDAACTVVNGGELGTRKGVNVLNVKIKLPALTDEGEADIQFSIEEGSDSIAAPLMRTADAALEIKQMLHNAGVNMSAIVKIENVEGVKNIDAIIEASDGIMVARGDMGVEIPAEQVPHIQKMIIRKRNEMRESVITAAQMLDSMIRNPRPTRAEVTDTANTVYDGTDAAMLSSETAMGKYLADALKTAAQVVEETGSYLNYSVYRERKASATNVHNIPNAVCYSSVSVAYDSGTQVIIAPSINGLTTRILSKWRPTASVIGLLPSIVPVRQMQTCWGVISFHARRVEPIGFLTESPPELLKEKDAVKEGDLAVVTAGVVTYAKCHEPMTRTNIMRVVTA